MNPERTSHEAAILGNRTPEYLAAINDLNQRRENYMNAKQRSRSWLNRIFRRGTVDTELTNTRTAYEEARARMIQIEARRNVDTVITSPIADPIYQRILANEVAEQLVREESILTQSEAERNRNNTMWRIRNALGANSNPALRAAIGWGLNAAIGVSMATGALPLTAALIGARVGFGAIGTEGAIAAFQNRNLANIDRQNVENMQIDEVNQRLSALSEYRIRNGVQTELAAELLLRDRQRALLAADIRPQFAGLEHWRRHQFEARAHANERTGFEGQLPSITNEFDALETAHTTLVGRRGRVEANLQQADTTITEQQRRQREAEENIQELTETREMADKVLSVDTANGGLINNAANVDQVEDACRRITAIDTRIATLNQRQNPPAFLIAQLEDEKNRIKRTDIRPYIVGRGPALNRNVNTIINAFSERERANREIPEQDRLKTEAINARRNANQNKRDLQNIIRGIDEDLNDMQADLADRNKLKLETEQKKNAAEAARVRATELSEDQAVRIHNLLLGGAAHRNGAVPAVAAGNGLITRNLDAITGLNEGRLNSERGSSRNRWLAALAISGLVTWLTTPDVNLYDWTHNGSGVNPDLRFVPGNPDVSSLWGRGEGLYWDYLNQNGANLVSEQDFRNLVNSDPATHTRAIGDYVNWVRINNPDALVNGNPDWIRHMPIREPGDLNRFFGTWAGPHQWDPTRSVMDAIRNLQVNLPNIPNPFPRVESIRVI